MPSAQWNGVSLEVEISYWQLAPSDGGERVRYFDRWEERQKFWRSRHGKLTNGIVA